jgi:hypothetical protein
MLLSVACGMLRDLQVLWVAVQTITLSQGLCCPGRGSCGLPEIEVCSRMFPCN